MPPCRSDSGARKKAVLRVPQLNRCACIGKPLKPLAAEAGRVNFAGRAFEEQHRVGEWREGHLSASTSAISKRR